MELWIPTYNWTWGPLHVDLKIQTIELRGEPMRPPIYFQTFWESLET